MNGSLSDGRYALVLANIPLTPLTSFSSKRSLVSASEVLPPRGRLIYACRVPDNIPIGFAHLPFYNDRSMTSAFGGRKRAGPEVSGCRLWRVPQPPAG